MPTAHQMNCQLPEGSALQFDQIANDSVLSSCPKLGLAWVQPSFQGEYLKIHWEGLLFPLVFRFQSRIERTH